MEYFFSYINDFLQYRFLQEALWISIMLGIGCGVVGCFIILRGLSLMGDAISHAIIPGVAISYVLGISYFVGAVVFGIVAALSMGFIKENSKIKSDTSIGIVFSAFLALGILLIAKIQSPIDLNNILFGNVLTIKNEERILTYIVIVGVLLTVFLFYKELLLTTFDPVMAKASGMNVKLINYILMIILTVITVVSLQTVGAILVVAMLITPASTAYLLTSNFKTMLILSALIGAVTSTIGLILSVSFNLPSGVTIVLTAAFLFLLVFAFSPRHGIFYNYIKTIRCKV